MCADVCDRPWAAAGDPSVVIAPDQLADWDPARKVVDAGTSGTRSNTKLGTPDRCSLGNGSGLVRLRLAFESPFMYAGRPGALLLGGRGAVLSERVSRISWFEIAPKRGKHAILRRVDRMTDTERLLQIDVGNGLPGGRGSYRAVRLCR